MVIPGKDLDPNAERMLESLERITPAILQLGDRQRVTTSATSVLFHGQVPSTLTQQFATSSNSAATITEMRFVNLGTSSALIEVFLIDWRQVSKPGGNFYAASPDLTLPANAVPADIVFRVTLAAKGAAGDTHVERCSIAMPERWQLRLQTNGDVAGHISGMELLTL